MLYVSNVCEYVEPATRRLNSAVASEYQTSSLSLVCIRQRRNIRVINVKTHNTSRTCPWTERPAASVRLSGRPPSNHQTLDLSPRLGVHTKRNAPKTLTKFSHEAEKV